jgi:hypothetical protein
MAWITADFDGVIIQVFGKCLKILKRRLHYIGVQTESFETIFEGNRLHTAKAPCKAFGIY